MVAPPRAERLVRRILLVEDEDFVAALLAEALICAGFDVRRAPDVLTARRIARSFDPDVALLDISLGPGPSGVDLGHYLDRVHPDVALIFLTRHPDRRTAGIDVIDIPERAGYLRKDLVGDLRALTNAIDAVLRERPSEHRHDRNAPEHPLRALTSRQIEALRLAALGLANASIARERGTTERAVEKTLQAALQTLEVPDDPDLNRRVEGIRRFIAAAGLPAREGRAGRASADRENDA